MGIRLGKRFGRARRSESGFGMGREKRFRRAHGNTSGKVHDSLQRTLPRHRIFYPGRKTGFVFVEIPLLHVLTSLGINLRSAGKPYAGTEMFRIAFPLRKAYLGGN